MGDALIYATGGYAQVSYPSGPFDPLTGYFIAVGVDYRLTESIIIGAEVLYHDLENDTAFGTFYNTHTSFGVNIAFTF